MKAWHFSKTNKRLDFGDDRKIILGKTLEIKGEPILYQKGLQGSVKILDAFYSASGPVIWRVNISGKIIKGDDKIVGTKRTAIAGGIDISETLREFARWCALRVAHLWDAPDYVIEYLKTGNEDLREKTSDVAWVAWAADSDAAGDAAGDARGAARAAAGDAAGDAAWDAARAAAWDATWGAERKEQNAKLTRMVNKAIKETNNGIRLTSKN